MKNAYIGGHEAEDIKKLVGKLLSDLGHPDPPLSLPVVRERLKLDLRYYSSTDVSAVREIVHKLKVAGKQILQRPTLLLDVVRKADLRALYLPDRRRILIDEELPKPKHRWAEGHEVLHSLIPWHSDFLLGDSERELTPTCLAQIEAEANYGNGQLLFLLDRFVDEAMSLPLEIASVKSLKESFGNTLTSTLWRFVEEYRGRKPMVGVVSVHPVHLKKDFDPHDPCRYIIQSPLFRKTFSKVTDIKMFSAIRAYCGPQRGGPLGSDEVILRDDNGERHTFVFETFFNRYEALTLGVHRTKIPASVRVRSKTV